MRRRGGWLPGLRGSSVRGCYEGGQVETEVLGVVRHSVCSGWRPADVGDQFFGQLHLREAAVGVLAVLGEDGSDLFFGDEGELEEQRFDDVVREVHDVLVDPEQTLAVVRCPDRVALSLPLRTSLLPNFLPSEVVSSGVVIP